MREDHLTRSISGTKELVPLFIKARFFSSSKRNSGQFSTRDVASPLSMYCCHSDSWKPVDDDNDPYKNNNSAADAADWREIRARLVAGEQTMTMDPSPSSPAPNGNKWAHKIHEPETGCLLIATEKLDGIHMFERTVILLLSVGPSGPTGIILNRPSSLMSIKEMKSMVLDVRGTFSDKGLFFGGPLEGGMFLVRPKGDGREENEVGKSGKFREVMKGLYCGTIENIGLVAEMVKRNLGRNEFRFFDGYCLWEKEQLDEEILSGYWTVAACSASAIGFGHEVNTCRLWDEVIGLIGPQTDSMI
ncbi:PREDICTED: uncharacterized protein LOC104822985 isoform X2 [Tarenaya hassleriana]|uniref:uncharacterized protein LOC104822985 isoform X2 n=1 Tax=Tarenaya hassleriana TaxID=28532 RepID=UPI00053C32F2|nr:PREDICTED: uncharacterized protein LOC104822985 isoform X2 [Tarenaya hassleriana]XP_010552704.1 PREDICTED: uncharacterized protein LOC104822985 isoform X2 [Tarenaya hassleriana]